MVILRGVGAKELKVPEWVGMNKARILKVANKEIKAVTLFLIHLVAIPLHASKRNKDK